MIEFIQDGGLFRSNAQVFVNTANCVGVMGKGIALEFKRRYPNNFRAYADACAQGSVIPGRMFVFETGLKQPQYIINFPTKRHWANPSRMLDIVSGLRALVTDVRRFEISSIAIPALGCNNGGLSWSAVRPEIERELAPLTGVICFVYEPLSR